MRPRIVGLLAVAGTLCSSIVGGELHAQVEPFEPSDGFLQPPVSSGPDVFTACATELPVRHDGPVVELECSVVDTTSVSGEPVGPAWLVQYRRGALLSYDEFVDSVAIDELVLVRPAPPTDFEILWHVPRIRTYEFIEQIESAQKDDGVLVSYLICVNGTGGCVEHFLFGASDWSVLAQPFLDELAAAVPEGWSLHKGRDLDLTTLEGVQPIARPGDANCCPSGMMRFRVEIVGDEMRLVDAGVGD